jgi:hypothetical protein
LLLLVGTRRLGLLLLAAGAVGCSCTAYILAILIGWIVIAVYLAGIIVGVLFVVVSLKSCMGIDALARSTVKAFSVALIGGGCRG